MTSKYTHMIWKTWDGEWNLELEDVAIYDIIHSQIMHEISVKNNNGGHKKWMICICALFVQKEVK